MEQGTKEWFAARCGKVTASKVADVIAKTKSGYSASRANYMAQLVAERLTGSPAESFSNAAMQWGTDYEPLARAEYEILTGYDVMQVGLISHPAIDNAGASPDGYVNDDGLIEIKCPNTATHIDYLLGKEPPSKYRPQMAWQIACTGREWCDFVSYDPRMPADLSLFVVRYTPSKEYLQELQDEVIRFLQEVDQMIEKLTALRGAPKQ